MNSLSSSSSSYTFRTIMKEKKRKIPAVDYCHRLSLDQLANFDLSNKKSNNSMTSENLFFSTLFAAKQQYYNKYLSFTLMSIVVLMSCFVELVPATESSTSQPTKNICQQFPALTGCQPYNEISEHKKFSTDPEEFNENLYDNFEKRKSAYMRFGKRYAPYEYETELFPEMAKRKSAYMRFGKRKSAYMRFGKRFDSEFNNELNDNINEVKRKSAYMRFGKRYLLADNNYNDMDMEKRKSAYMRFGRR